MKLTREQWKWILCVVVVPLTIGLSLLTWWHAITFGWPATILAIVVTVLTIFYCLQVVVYLYVVVLKQNAGASMSIIVIMVVPSGSILVFLKFGFIGVWIFAAILWGVFFFVRWTKRVWRSEKAADSS